MARLQLTWIGALKVWRKQYKGKRYSFGEANTVEGYKAALARWETKRAAIDATERKAKEQNACAQWKGILDNRPGALNALQAPPVATTATITSEEEQAALASVPPVYGDAYGYRKKHGGKTMAAMIADYIAEQENRYKQGVKFPTAPQPQRISAQRFIAYRYNANLMADAWGAESLPTNESELARLMIDFRNRCRTLMNEGTIKPSTYNERIKTLRHFIGWAHDNYLIPTLPRKTGEICGKYKLSSTAKAIPLDSLHTMWGAADTTLKTYMALALNCGFKAGDISHLTAANVQGNYISCNRNKTGVPMRYKLWSITKELLSQHTPGETTLFQTAEGERLITVDVNGGANGKGQRKSKVDNKFAILRRKLKINGFSFDNFRDTSTTWIEAHDPAVSDMFDAHADNRMARFYVDRSRLDLDKMYAPLDRATDALEKHYNLQITVGDDPDPVGGGVKAQGNQIS